MLTGQFSAKVKLAKLFISEEATLDAVKAFGESILALLTLTLSLTCDVAQRASVDFISSRLFCT